MWQSACNATCMKLTGLEALDSSIQRTNAWIKELMQELNWTDRRRAYLALRCVLQAVRDHLSVEQAVQFGEQLPTLIRGFYFEHWSPNDKPAPFRSQKAFFQGVCSYLERNSSDSLDAEVVVRAVFRLLDRKAAEGETENLQNILPRGLKDLWPPTLRAA